MAYEQSYATGSNDKGPSMSARKALGNYYKPLLTSMVTQIFRQRLPDSYANTCLDTCRDS